MQHTVTLAVCGIALSFVMGAKPSQTVAQTLQPIQRFSVEAIAVPKDGKEDVGSHADKIDSVYRASQWYLRGATALDMSTTVIGLESTHGVEAGWARCFGPHNTTAVVAGNVAMNLGVEFLSRKIHRRGGKWRYIATGLNVLKGTTNLEAGVHNARYISQH